MHHKEEFIYYELTFNLIFQKTYLTMQQNAFLNNKHFFCCFQLCSFCLCVSVHMRDCRRQQEIRHASKQSWPSHSCATPHCTEEAEGNHGGKEPGIQSNMCIVHVVLFTVMAKNTGTAAFLSYNARLFPGSCCNYKLFVILMFLGFFLFALKKHTKIFYTKLTPPCWNFGLFFC